MSMYEKLQFVLLFVVYFLVAASIQISIVFKVHPLPLIIGITVSLIVSHTIIPTLTNVIINNFDRTKEIVK